MKRTALFYFLLPVFGALPAIAQSVPSYVIHSSKHYRDSGVGNANGRSGSAHMTARALLGKDGNTIVEVTTGALDSSATPPGNFKKVQFKALDPDGDALFAQNFFPTSAGAGLYSFSWPGLYRHEQAQIQGNIAGIDNRDDVVTVVETVKLRPDLTIQNFQVPASAMVNMPVIIPANVVELNGDASATTNCVLAINGVKVDQTGNIYVDAAGSVSCAFSYTFKSVGNYTVQVTATNVAPADWDTSNNSASGNINIIDVNTNKAEHGTVSFTDQNGGFPLSSTLTMQAWKAGVLVYDFGLSSATTGEQQNMQSEFWSSGCPGTGPGTSNAVPFQFPVDVAYTETMDGAQVFSTKATGITGVSSTYPASVTQCGSPAVSFVVQMGSTIADDYVINITSSTYYDSGGNALSTTQDVSATRNAGDVTYLSSQYLCDWFKVCSTTDPSLPFQVLNNNSENKLGTLIPLGSTWVPSLTVTDATGAGFGGNLSVSLLTGQQVAGQPNTCQTTGPDTFGYTRQNCSSSSTNYTLTQGNASY
jgi:hypothetical protein